MAPPGKLRCRVHNQPLCPSQAQVWVAEGYAVPGCCRAANGHTLRASVRKSSAYKVELSDSQREVIWQLMYR